MVEVGERKGAELCIQESEWWFELMELAGKSINWAKLGGG